MTGPAVSSADQDPLDALKALKSQRAPVASDDPLEQLKALKSAPAGHDYHAEYASGALSARMAGANARDAANLADEQGSEGPTSRIGAFGQSLAATGANIAQGIPGMEAAEAGVRSLARGQSYRASLADIQHATAKIPTPLRVTEKIAGAVPLATLLPSNPALGGAIVGGADQALSANPDESIGGRATRTAVGATAGALTGKLGEKLVTAGKALLPSALGGVGEGADAAFIRMRAEQAQSAKTLYAQALQEGKSNEVTQPIRDFLAEDDIAKIVAKIRGGRTGAQMDTPELLDRVYKELSDMQKQAGKVVAAVDPSNPNAAVSRLADIKAAKKSLLSLVSKPTTKPPLTLDVAPETFETEPVIDAGRPRIEGPPVTPGASSPAATPEQTRALEGLQRHVGEAQAANAGADLPATLPRGPVADPTPGFVLRERQPSVVRPGVRIETPGMTVQTAPAEQAPALMPSYQKAVEDYAQRAKEIGALKRGYEVVQKGTTQRLPAVGNLGRKTPLAFAEWAATASPQEVAAARRGILGGVRDATSLGGLTLKPGRDANAVAGKLLRAAPSQSQDLTEVLQNLGLLTAGNSSP